MLKEISKDHAGDAEMIIQLQEDIKKHIKDFSDTNQKENELLTKATILLLEAEGWDRAQKAEVFKMDGTKDTPAKYYIIDNKTDKSPGAK
jgi:hypothetical protein